MRGPTGSPGSASQRSPNIKGALVYTRLRVQDCTNEVEVNLKLTGHEIPLTFGVALESTVAAAILVPSSRMTPEACCPQGVKVISCDDGGEI